MTPIRITYDRRKGNVLSARLSKKKEVIYSIAADRSVIGFEILNFLSKRERRPSKTLPVQARLLMAS